MDSELEKKLERAHNLDKHYAREMGRKVAEEQEKEILRNIEDINILDGIHDTIGSGPKISGRKIAFDQLPHQVQERYADPTRIVSIRFYFNDNREWYCIRFEHNYVHKWSKEGRKWVCQIIDITVKKGE